MVLANVRIDLKTVRLQCKIILYTLFTAIGIIAIQGGLHNIFSYLMAVQ